MSGTQQELFWALMGHHPGQSALVYAEESISVDLTDSDSRGYLKGIPKQHIQEH